MLIDEIATYLQAQGVGTVNTDIFLGALPSEPDNCLMIRSTGGGAPDAYIAVKNPTVQIISRADDYQTAHDKIQAAYDALNRKANFELTSGGTYVMACLAIQEPGDIGQDENNNYEISCNFKFIVR